MHTYIKTLQEISTRYAPSRILSFDIAHVFKALQLIETRGHTSRDILCGNIITLGLVTINSYDSVLICWIL